MTTEGPSQRIPHGATLGQYVLLKTVFVASQSHALVIAADPKQAMAAYQPPDSDQHLYEEFALIGMATVDDNCSDFFSTAGEHEKFVNFTRDVVAAAGTLASGALALSGVSKDAIAALTLSVGAGYSGLDVYTKNFLFGADNIDSVRTLVLNALNAHQRAVLQDPSPWTFNNAMRVILDHQEICRPSAIVGLVKSAIKNGNVTPNQPNQQGQSNQQQGQSAAAAKLAHHADAASVAPAPAPYLAPSVISGTKHISVTVQ